MRVIAGTHRGRRIEAPKGQTTRPTGDRVREAAFNLIGPVDDADVLDLYAGSGAMGIEALSRGAASATFVESDRDACRTIDRNLERLGLLGRVLCGGAKPPVVDEHLLRADGERGCQVNRILGAQLADERRGPVNDQWIDVDQNE